MSKKTFGDINKTMDLNTAYGSLVEEQPSTAMQQPGQPAGFTPLSTGPPVQQHSQQQQLPQQQPMQSRQQQQPMQPQQQSHPMHPQRMQPQQPMRQHPQQQPMQPRQQQQPMHPQRMHQQQRQQQPRQQAAQQNNKQQQRFVKQDGDNKQTGSKNKGWMIAGIVLVFLIVGVLIAMVAYKGKTTYVAPIGQPVMMNPPSNIPAYVGVSNAKPPAPRQWYESASTFGRE